MSSTVIGQQYEKKNWNPFEIFALIQLYQERRCLWDTSDENYRNRMKKSEALIEIAVRLDTNVPEIQRKIHNMRNQFCQEVAKAVKIKANGSIENYEPKWPYFDALKFIQSAIMTRKPPTTGNTTTVNTEQEGSSTLVYESESPAVSDKTAFSISERMTLKREWHSDNEYEDIQEEYMCRQPSPLPPPSSPKMMRHSTYGNDDFDVFGAYVASEMRALTGKYQVLLKQKILQAIIDISHDKLLGQ